MGKTLYEKIFDKHRVLSSDDTHLIYIDRHLIHEVTSPQAFEGLKINNRQLWRKESIVAVPDHNVPTMSRDEGIKDPVSKIQVDTLNENWIYIQEQGVKVGRIQIFNNWSPYLVEKKDCIWLGLEYFCNEEGGFTK